ncbi:MAG: hypothetical protein QM811_02315 [Pirellulales bacterium]
MTEVSQTRSQIAVQQHVARLQVAVQHAFIVCMAQTDGQFAGDFHRLRDGQLAFLFEHVLETAVVEVLHYVIRRRRVPADIQQLNDVPIGREVCQFFDFAGQQRPISPGLRREELNRHAAIRRAIERDPHFAERAGS